MTTLVVIGAAVVYLVVGFAFAYACIPASWARHNAKYAKYVNPGLGNSGAVTADAVVRTLLWPVMVPIEVLVRRVHATDPQLTGQRQDELTKRIAELERDLGIGDGEV